MYEFFSMVIEYYNHLSSQNNCRKKIKDILFIHNGCNNYICQNYFIINHGIEFMMKHYYHINIKTKLVIYFL